MANSVSHGELPYPIRGARFSFLLPYLAADGTPTDPTTPDTEVSKDNGSFADCAEEVATATGSNGLGYLTLSGAETDCGMIGIAAKVASGPKPTLMTLYPRRLAVLSTGTAQAGAAGSMTLASGGPGYDVTGCFAKTTGGTGGGGSGGANNQVRKIMSYNPSTKVATVAPNWETNPSSDTTYDILLPEGMTPAQFLALQPATPGRTIDLDATGYTRLQSAAITDLLGTVVENNGSVTMKGFFRLAGAVLFGRTTSNGETFKTADNVKTRLTSTTDSNNNRTSITADVTD
jgi:hypothetical protein